MKLDRAINWIAYNGTEVKPEDVSPERWAAMVRYIEKNHADDVDMGEDTVIIEE